MPVKADASAKLCIETPSASMRANISFSRGPGVTGSVAPGIHAATAHLPRFMCWRAVGRFLSVTVSMRSLVKMRCSPAAASVSGIPAAQRAERAMLKSHDWYAETNMERSFGGIARSAAP